MELDIVKQTNASLMRSLKLMEENNSMLEQKNLVLFQQNETLVERLNKSRSMSDLQKILWFGAGVLGTGLVAWGVSRAVRK